MIKLRKAKKEDLNFCLDLRNEPGVRRASFNQEIISLNRHKEWFLDKIQNLKTIVLIIEEDAKSIGQIRIDLGTDSAEINVSLLPEYRNGGRGSLSLKMACAEAFKLSPETEVIVAHIKSDNAASVNSFIKAGFKYNNLVKFKGQDCLEFVMRRKNDIR